MGALVAGTKKTALYGSLGGADKGDGYASRGFREGKDAKKRPSRQGALVVSGGGVKRWGV